MLEFENFKILKGKDPNFALIRFKFKDDELSEEMVEYIDEEIKNYDIYLGYDCKGDFEVKYKKVARIEMTVKFPSRKVPQEKKELESFINKHVMDFREYYSRIDYYKDFEDDNLVESSY